MRMLTPCPPPPPPPPHCKVLGRCAAALTLTLAAAVGGASPAQAQQGEDPLPDPPCVAATHFEINDKCLPKTGDLPHTVEVCIALGGYITSGSGGPAFCNGYLHVLNAAANALTGRCQWGQGIGYGFASSCGAANENNLAPVRDCNKANKIAEVSGSTISCAASACGGGTIARGGRCRSPLNCQGNLQPNSAGDACVCPTGRPYFGVGSTTECVAQCGLGETLDQAANQCEVCAAGRYKTEAGNGPCDLCFSPLLASESDPDRSPRAGRELVRNASNRAVACEPIDECQLDEPLNTAAAALELCGPNAACNELDPRDHPNGFTVGEWKYSCECNEGFSDPNDGGQAVLNCSEVPRTVAVSASPNGTVSASPPAGELDFETQVVFTATPDSGFMVSAWVGVDEWIRSGNCDAGTNRCEVTVTRDLEVRADFEDLNECGVTSGPNRHHCPSNSSCVNLDAALGGDRFTCECDNALLDYDSAARTCSGAREVAISASPNGTVSSTPPAGELDVETEVIFTATPDFGFMVSVWTGVDEWIRSGNCDAGANRCEVTVTRDLEVRAIFGDLNECDFTTGPNRFDCPADSSCENLDAALGGGRFTCVCDDASLGYVGGVCTGAREVAILASSGGAVSAVVSGDGTVIETKGEVANGATVVLRAAPVAGARVSVWLGVSGVGDCAANAAECVVTVTRNVEVGALFEDVDECAASADDCPSDSSCRNLDAVSGGGRFACDCDESLYEFDEAARSCGCATAGHLIFGEGGDRECKSPVICPSGYDDSNFDCVEDEAVPLTPEQVASRDLCLAFGGVREAVVDLAHPGVCSEVDINDTFCFLEAGEALSCRGLFEHVRDCNALNRPALDPWHCAAACGDKQARGRRCETVTR